MTSKGHTDVPMSTIKVESLKKVKVRLSYDEWILNTSFFLYVTFLFCFIYILEVYFIKKVLSIKIFRNVIQTYKV